MKAEASANPARPNINVTPLIDILLVLLIIFMVMTPLRPARFRALVPEPIDDDAVRMSPRTLVVEVAPDLRLRLLRGAQPVAEASVDDPGPVAARLADEFKQRREREIWKADYEARGDLPPDRRIERTVFLKAPRSVRYGEIAKVIDGMKGAGAEPIGLQTEQLGD